MYKKHAGQKHQNKTDFNPSYYGQSERPKVSDWNLLNRLTLASDLHVYQLKALEQK